MSTGGVSEDPAAGVVAPSPVELNFNTNGTGNIEQPTEFNIPSEYTWSEALKYINSHPALYMTIPVTFNLTDDANVEAPADANYAAFQDLKLTLKSNGNKLNVPNDIAGNVKSLTGHLTMPLLLNWPPTKQWLLKHCLHLVLL